VTFGSSGFFTGTRVSSTNKTDRHDIIVILLKVALKTITLTLTRYLKDVSIHSNTCILGIEI
jgi:hypothetical protein